MELSLGIFLFLFLGFVDAQNNTPVSPLQVPEYQFLRFDSSGNPPSPRINAAVGISLDGTSLFLFGGNASTEKIGYELNLTSSNWSQFDLTFAHPSGCSAQNLHSDFIWALSDGVLSGFNLTTRESASFGKASISIPDDVSCAATQSNNFYVFGADCSNDVVFWDRTEWKPLNFSQGDFKPEPRSGAGLVFLDPDTLILVGGTFCTPPTTGLDVWRLNITEGTWVNDDDNSDSGFAPAPRSHHSVVLDNTGQNASLIIFGGMSDGADFDEVWKYDLVTMIWTQLNHTQDQPWPTARAYHSSAWSLGRLLTFGGSTDDQPNNEVWQLILNGDCFSFSDCPACSQVPGCGWCQENIKNYQCIAGQQSTGAYTKGACLKGDPFVLDFSTCVPAFPGWIISLSIIAGIIVVGVVVYVVTLFRKDQGYQEL